MVTERSERARLPVPVAVRDHGPPGRRFNILLIADGYPERELELFAKRVEAFCRRLFEAAPFDLLHRLINVYRLDLVTPADAGALGATFGGAGVSHRGRMLTVDESAALRLAAEVLPGTDLVIVQCNRAGYGGSGGRVAVYSAHPRSVEVALHEIGHTAFGLGDEYSYPAGDRVADPDAETDWHSGEEPPFPNLTCQLDRGSLKWGHLVDAETPLPTTDPTVGVGAFEGGDYHARGVYRPSSDCRMRTIGSPFCPVCQQQIRALLLQRTYG